MPFGIKQTFVAAGIAAAVILSLSAASIRLQSTLHKHLSAPLQWTIAYPSITGDLVFRGLRLGSPPVLSADTADADLAWRSLFEENIRLEHLDLSYVRGELPTTDSAAILRALKGAQLRFARKGERAQSEGGETEAQDGAGKAARRLTIGSFAIQDGNITLIDRSNRRILLSEMYAFGERVSFPISESINLSAHFRVRDESFPAEESYPVTAKFVWDNGTKSLRATLTVESFPLSILNGLFPDAVSPQVGSVPQLTAGDSSVIEGKMTGTITLIYTAKDDSSGTWSLSTD